MLQKDKNMIKIENRSFKHEFDSITSYNKKKPVVGVSHLRIEFEKKVFQLQQHKITNDDPINQYQALNKSILS